MLIDERDHCKGGVDPHQAECGATPGPPQTLESRARVQGPARLPLPHGTHCLHGPARQEEDTPDELAQEEEDSARGVEAVGRRGPVVDLIADRVRADGGEDNGCPQRAHAVARPQRQQHEGSKKLRAREPYLQENSRQDLSLIHCHLLHLRESVARHQDGERQQKKRQAHS